MGYTSTMKDKGESVADFFKRRYFGENSTILASGLVNLHEFYAAIKDNKTGEVWAFVARVDLNINDHGFNFGYRDMDETAGPYYYNCPKKVLKLLTETTSQYALEWREKCWQNIQRKEQLYEGVLIQFKQPFRFQSCDKLQTLQIFKLVKGRKRGLELSHPDNFYARYTIPNWKKMDFAIIDPCKPSNNFCSNTLFE